MRMFKALSLAGLLSMFGVSSAFAGGTLSTSDLHSLFPGKFQAVVSGLVTVSITAKSDGSLEGRLARTSDSGRWSVQGGKLCIALDKWMGGKTRCSQVIEESGWFKAAEVKFRKL